MIGAISVGAMSDKAASQPKATGGTITQSGAYFYHTFTGNGTFTPLTTISCDVLVIAGGGSTQRASGGAGAGQVLYYASESLSSAQTVTVGAGGTGDHTSLLTATGTQGSSSTFGSLSAALGGYVSNPYLPSSVWSNGADSRNTYTGGAASANGGGGGGGAGANGGAASSSVGGAGGIGIDTYSTWASATSTGISGRYAAGGGGGLNDGGSGVGGTGGTGGGGNGGGSNGLLAATDGAANTGSGGGGGSNNSPYGGNGGSGIIIVRYLAA